jgi:hypothetical protein
VKNLLTQKKRSGPLGLMSAGKDAKAKKTHDTRRHQARPLAIRFGGTRHANLAGTLSSATRTYIVNNKSKLKRVAFFCTNGSGSQQLFAEMESLCEKRPVNVLALPQKEVKEGAYQDKLRQFVDELLVP